MFKVHIDIFYMIQPVSIISPMLQCYVKKSIDMFMARVTISIRAISNSCFSKIIVSNN